LNKQNKIKNNERKNSSGVKKLSKKKAAQSG
jgi:hypothetical protein